MPSVIHKSAEGTEIVPYINDGTVDWNNIHSLYIYTDGYYGRSIEEPLLIEDANTIEDIIRIVLKEEQYHKVPFELYYEGKNAFFIQFDNDVWICMYEDEENAVSRASDGSSSHSTSTDKKAERDPARKDPSRAASAQAGS